MPTSGTDTGGTGTGGTGGGRVLGLADALLDNGIIKLGFGYLNDVTSHYFESLNQSLNLTKAALEQQNKIYIANMELASKVLQNSLNVAVDGFSKSANEIASQSLKYRISEAKANIEAEKKKYLLEKTFMTERMKAQGAMVSSFSDMLNNYAANSFGLVKSIFDLRPGSNIGGVLSEFSESWGEAAEQIFNGLSRFSSGVVSVSAQFGIESAKLFNTALKKNVSYSLELMQYEKMKAELLSDHIESVINSASDILEKYSDLYSKVLETVSKADTESHIQAVQMGWVGDNAQIFTRHMIETTRDLAQDFGKSTEELIAMQKAYIDESTRNVILSKADYQSMLGIGRGFGLNDNETAQLFGSMNVFNTSAEHGESMLANMYKSITKMGLSAGKFGKDLVNNLQKAQKYNFKGGLENMMKITQWAQQTRFNLDAATGFSDRLLNGTISDALEASAKLQVLGGAAAMYSDPIAMLYEAGADIGSLAKRQAAMFNDIQGTFNAKTGETDFSWYENYMIKQRAQAAGISEEDAKNMIRQRHKQKVIDKELRDSGFTEEQKVAIGNAALYDAEEGQWKVTDIHGEKHSLQEVMDNTDLLKQLMPDNKDDAMLKIAQDSLGFAEKQTRLQAYIASKFGASNYSDIVDVSNRNLAEEKGFYTDYNVVNHIDEMIKNASEAEHLALQEQYATHKENIKGITIMWDKFMEFINGKANGKKFNEEMGAILATLSVLNQSSENPEKLEGETDDQYAKRLSKRASITDTFERYIYDLYSYMYSLKIHNKIGDNPAEDLFYLRGDNGQDYELYDIYESTGGNVNGIPITPTNTRLGTDVRYSAWSIGSNVRDYASRGATITAPQDLDVVTMPLLNEMDNLEFFNITGSIGVALGEKIVNIAATGLGNLFDDIGNYVRGRLLSSNNSNPEPTAQNNTIPASEPTYEPIQPQNVSYDNYAENVHSDQANQPLLSNGYANVQYLAVADGILNTPLSNEIGELANSIERLNTSIERMQISQSPLTIDNDVYVTNSYNMENIKQAMLASLNDSTFTAKLTKGLAVVSSDSYQYNGTVSVT